MELPYSEYQLPNGNTISRPTLDVIFKYKSNQIPVKAALLDTGADGIVLPLDFANVFGFRFDIDKDAVEYIGAGNNKFKVYPSPSNIQISLNLPGFRPKWWDAKVTFTLQQPTILLGHKGFLEKFDMKFCGAKKVIEFDPLC